MQATAAMRATSLGGVAEVAWLACRGFKDGMLAVVCGSYPAYASGTGPPRSKCGSQGSNLQPRDSRAPRFPWGLDYLILHIGKKRPSGGRALLRRGVLLGLTPLVSEPTWLPEEHRPWLNPPV